MGRFRIAQQPRLLCTVACVWLGATGCGDPMFQDGGSVEHSLAARHDWDKGHAQDEDRAGEYGEGASEQDVWRETRKPQHECDPETEGKVKVYMDALVVEFAREGKLPPLKAKVPVEEVVLEFVTIAAGPRPRSLVTPEVEVELPFIPSRGPVTVPTVAEFPASSCSPVGITRGRIPVVTVDVPSTPPGPITRQIPSFVSVPDVDVEVPPNVPVTVRRVLVPARAVDLPDPSAPGGVRRGTIPAVEVSLTDEEEAEEAGEIIPVRTRSIVPTAAEQNSVRRGSVPVSTPDA